MKTMIGDRSIAIAPSAQRWQHAPHRQRGPGRSPLPSTLTTFAMFDQGLTGNQVKMIRTNKMTMYS